MTSKRGFSSPRKAGKGDPRNSHPLIVEILLQKGLLAPEKLNSLREVQTKSKLLVEEALVKAQLATEETIAAAYADYMFVPCYSPPENHTVDRDLARLLPEKLCRERRVAPIEKRGDTLDIAMVDPTDMALLDEIQLATGLTVRPMVVTLNVAQTLLDGHYGDATLMQEFSADPADDRDDEDLSSEKHAEQAALVLDLDQASVPGREGRVVRFGNQVFEQALRNGASDIHLEPLETSCRIRLRIDGQLHEITPPARGLFVSILSRFKILARMDIAEKRIPQDGAIALKQGDRRVDIRVNTVPTVHGEKMVMRILDKSAIPLDLTGLGLDETQCLHLHEAIQSPHGLMLVTGPTGSGKSTTLYSCLNLLNAKPDANICTVEDPVEYKFDGINQVQVKPQVNLTFASALRAFLRQDPDIIMVGEVRDQETAQICVKAALTGHFVLSTLHTNDALAAVNRLQDMGVDPFLLASTLRLLEAQRLIRKLCKECKVLTRCDAETSQRYGIEEAYKPKGCNNCRGSGYRGRVGIFEVIRIDPHLANLVQSRAALPELRAAARQQGMMLLADSAMAKVQQGVTSLEEALGVAIADE
jgi:type IV pilus assembly protein PilB